MNQPILAAAPVARVIRSQRCETCKFALVAGRALHCHRNPPSVALIPGNNGQPVPVSAWPPVQADGFCGEWRAKVEGVN